MGLDASQILGSPELVGVKVNPRGLGKTVMSRSMHSSVGGGIAGVVTGAVIDTAISRKLAGSAEAQRAEATGSATPTFPKIAWLALTADEIALVEVSTRTTLKLTGAVLARTPRSEIVAIELRRAKPMVAWPLAVRFAGGDAWVLEVPAFSKRTARTLADLVGAGRVS